MDEERAAALSFDDLFREQLPSIHREVSMIVGDSDVAREIAGEAFTRLFVRWHRVSRYQKPGAWVRRVAVRLAVRHVERGRGHVELTDLVARADDRDAAAAIDVRRAVRVLPAKQRAAVVLHYFEGLPLAEVADVIGCREGTVKAHLHQARTRLAALLPGYAQP